MNPYHSRITVTAKKFAAKMRYRIVLTPLIRHRALAFHATGSLRLVPHPFSIVSGFVITRRRLPVALPIVARAGGDHLRVTHR
jgi:hypothetical protein